MSNLPLQSDQAQQLAETFGLLADRTRVSIVATCVGREVSAGDIATEVGVSASLVSHHLRLLRAARILRSERRGKQIFYSLADACVRDVLTIMVNHLFSHDYNDPTDPEGES